MCTRLISLQCSNAFQCLCSDAPLNVEHNLLHHLCFVIVLFSVVGTQEVRRLVHSGTKILGGTNSTRKLKILTEIFGFERNFGEQL